MTDTSQTPRSKAHSADIVTLSVFEKAELAVVEAFVEAVAGLKEPRVGSFDRLHRVKVAWNRVAREVAVRIGRHRQLTVRTTGDHSHIPSKYAVHMLNAICLPSVHNRSLHLVKLR
jgi:hypothetical protein